MSVRIRRGDRDSLWDSTELARQLVASGIVGSISPTTVRRIKARHRLKPWRHHLWLSPKVPRDAAEVQSIQEIDTLYTRQLSAHEMVLRVDEKTSLQQGGSAAVCPGGEAPPRNHLGEASPADTPPRPRKAATLPAQPGLPVRVEHEYERKGALNLFAAFDTRTGQVWGQTYERKRQEEFIAFLEYLNREISCHISTIHLVLDNLSVHKGKKVQAWLAYASTFCVPSSSCSLFVDESSGTVVWYPTTQAPANC